VNSLNIGGTATGALSPLSVGQHFIAALENADGTNASTFNQQSVNTLTVNTRM
jgi:hypothetical protein